MIAVRARGEAVRRFIIQNLAKHPTDITRIAAEKFGFSRQAIHRHLQRLIEEGAIRAEGTTRRSYTLASLIGWQKDFALDGKLTEDRVWREEIAPSLGRLPENATRIWQYGFTEMLNNAIDHSGGRAVRIQFEKTAARTEISILDDGVGIFRKIQRAMGLEDVRHAVLELAKGKFTTDPANHSGEGIFFSSRVFDRFEILSGGVYFSHEFLDKEDWILQPPVAAGGTLVQMRLHNHTSRSLKKVFDRYASGDDDYGFTKTVVPVKLMQYGDDNLVSRSQAKRLLARFDRFKVVMLDFSGVQSIGQSFADEVFRVFQSQHPEVELIPFKASSEVKRMIARAEAHDGPSAE